MANVRIIKAINNAGENVLLFVYRGYYCIRRGKAAYHTNKYLRDGVKLANISDNDVFSLDCGVFGTPNRFKRMVDEHIKYIHSAFGSLDYYFSLNS